MRINVTVLVLFVCLGLGKASTSEAFGCPVYDREGVWGIGTVFQQVNANTFRITATTHVDHVEDHPFCSGGVMGKTLADRGVKRYILLVNVRPESHIRGYQHKILQRRLQWHAV